MSLPYHEIADGIYCIDTGLYRHGLAACYLVREGDRLAFVDNGTARTVPTLLGVIAELGLTPGHVDYVIPTHVHLDHAGGSGALMAACRQARLVVHPKGAPHLIDPSKLTAGAIAVYGEDGFARDFERLEPVPAERITTAEDGLELDLGGRPLTFIDTPGHANHHGCVFDAKTRGFFTGDTFGISYRECDTERGPLLFAPTTPVAFDPERWLESLDRLMSFEPQAMYLTHYGRVDRPAELVDELRQGIRDMAALALAEEGRADDERETRLECAVGDYLIGRARVHGVALDGAELARLFGVDTRLNAQGLEVWLRRRAKRAAQA
ncbi:Zn-dependent hydrolase, glyoxylase [Thioflavicoccus mobilis 8321]|uniref:Zn-dependent hydrolase, glyoxylase n=1 Tax=Thioflavicoccus mobilis 8321 TaxID=765912 RepID=L0H2K3_9GAMM|nr:MBL fold metallo-hydrolase [Thioflavicoccus mobilis]AGA92287.1 Zn-dependent hydrolase, glyoxylase [Thioflavicoccus mobilis 8321]